MLRRSRKATVESKGSTGSQQAVTADPNLAIQRLLDTDPRFQVFTMDGLHWIEPSQGRLVSAAFDSRPTIIQWIKDHGPWSNRPLKSERFLKCLRWFHWLRENIMNEPRLRFFNPHDGSWLNPFNGSWEGQVIQESGTLNRTILQAMSTTLVDCPQTQNISTYPDRFMLDRDVLRARVAGDSPFQTSELPIYQTEVVSRQPSGVFDTGSFEVQTLPGTQDLSAIGQDLAEQYPQADAPQFSNDDEVRWIIMYDDIEMAPITSSQLRQLAEKGKISEETLIKREHTTRYFRAAHIHGLLSGREQRYSAILDELQTQSMTLEQLRNLVAKGRINRETTLIEESNKEHITAGQLTELWRIRTPAPVARVAPTGEHPVPKSNQGTATVTYDPLTDTVQPTRPPITRQDSIHFSTETHMQQQGSSQHPGCWMVTLGGMEVPVISDDLKTMARNGQITPETLVRREHMAHSVPARQVKGLFMQTGPVTKGIAKPVERKRSDSDDFTQATQSITKDGVVPQRWVVQIKGNEQMIVTQVQLKQMARDRKITGETKVRREDMQGFIAADQIRGLF